LKRKIVGASIYPIVVIIIAICVVLAIMTFIVPKFEDVFKSVKVTMPPMTVALMGASNFVKNWWFVLIFAPIGAYFLMKAWGRTKGGRLAIDRSSLHAALIGPINNQTVIAPFCSTLGTLLQSGVPIQEDLNI